MSWNTSRILNDLEYEINENKQDISMLEQKTLYISDQLSVDGTVFLNNVYSEAFVKNGGTSSQYLMADGSTTTNSQQGQPNIYLYNNNNSGTPEPASGQIRANDPNNQNVTQLYISHITSDGIDIDIFLQQITTISVIYLQDRNNSNNNVRFNVTGAIIDNPNLYVTVPVIFDIAQGSGSIDFGDGHPLFMSIFDNSQLIDSRISAVETKTQHITASSDVTNFNSVVNMNNNGLANVKYPTDIQDASTKGYVDTSIEDLNLSQYTPLSDFNNLTSTVTTQGQYINELEVVTQNQSATASLTTFIDSTQLLLDTNQSFRIKSPDLLQNYMLVTPTLINTYTPINMDAKELLNVAGVKISGADNSDFFIKTNGGIDANTYLQSADLSELESKTQNQTATDSRTTFDKGIQFKLRDGSGDVFQVTNDGDPLQSLKFLVSQDSVVIYQPLLMSNNSRIEQLADPINPQDATTKKYVDDFNTALISNITTLQNKTQNIVASNVINTITKTTQFKLSNSDIFTITDDSGPFVSVTKFQVQNTNILVQVPMSMNGYQLSGIPTPIDDDQCPNKLYVDDLITPLQAKTQNQTATNSRTTFDKGIQFKLRDGSGDLFQVTNNGSPLQSLKFLVSQDSVVIYQTLLMANNSRIEQLGAPINPQDATTKLYVDNAINLQGLSPTYRQAKQVTSVTTNGLLETIMTATPAFGSYTWTDTAIGQTRKWHIHGAQTRSNFSATYTIRLKTNGNTNITWVLPATPSAVVNNQLFSIEITQMRQASNALYYFLKFNSFDATAAGYSFFTSQNTGGSVVGLNVSGTYTITIQSSIGTANLTFHSVDVTAILN